MILVDTSVWVDHFRSGDAALSDLLMRGRVLGHPHVIGELALGRLRRRTEIIADLRLLPMAYVAQDAEVLGFIDAAELAGCGVGYVDAHLLAAVRLTAGASLRSRDRRLRSAAVRLGAAAALA